MFRTIQTGGWLAGAACLLFAAAASAQLTPATWIETVILGAGDVTQEWDGQNDALPEPLLYTLPSVGSLIEGDLTFGPTGPPFISALAKQSMSNYGGGEATSRGRVTFQLRLIEKSAPPVVVDYVPLRIGVQGSVVVSGNCSQFCIGSAGAAIVLMNGDIEVLRKTASANMHGDLGPILLDSNQSISLHPQTVLTGSVIVQAYVGGAPIPGMRAEATAFAGPAFEITSAFIAGTESQYRDFFEIEYSPGYWALGNPTPVTPTTWGRIKSLYSDGR